MPTLRGVAARIARRLLDRRITVVGESMAPSLCHGDQVVVSGFDRQIPALSRGEIVVLKAPGTDREDVKRIVGLPGELVEIRDGVLMIDSRPTDEPYINAAMPPDWHYAWNARPTEYVVLGDNRAASTDSRRYGPVPVDRITGRVRRRAER
ncbi:MAG: signal peptidase I [Chloroflexota bacterium]